MTDEELKKYIKEYIKNNLRVEIDSDFAGSEQVILYLEDEEISSSSYITNDKCRCSD